MGASGSIYQRKDERWVGCAELPSDNGKRKRKYVYAASEREVKRLLNKLLVDIDNGTLKFNDSTTLQSLLNAWYDVHKPKIAPTTAGLYKMYIDRHIAPEIGCIKLRELKPIKLDQFYNKKLSEGLSPNTVIKFHTLIHQALKYAVKNDMIVVNPADGVSLPKKINYKPNIYNEEKFNALLEKVKGTIDEIPIILAGAVGLRRGEIFGLRWRDIDFNEKTISIVETIVRWDKYTTKAPKSESSNRTIKVYDFVLDTLKSYRNTLKVVPEHVVTQYTPNSFSHHFKALLEKHDLPHIRLHDLRHYNAIIMLKYGIPDIVAAERLGHADTTMLKKVYQHTLKEMHEDAANKLEAAFIRSKFDSHFDSQKTN